MMKSVDSETKSDHPKFDVYVGQFEEFLEAFGKKLCEEYGIDNEEGCYAKVDLSAITEDRLYFETDCGTEDGGSTCTTWYISIEVYLMDISFETKFSNMELVGS